MEVGVMDWSEDRILAEELAALSATGGASGGLVRMVAKVMRKNVHEVDLLVPLPFEDALRHVSEVLGRVGRVVPVGSGESETEGEREGESQGEGRATVRVVTGGGVGGLNPVVVTARVLSGAEAGTEVWLRAAAKEGLIRQRAGERTAVSVAALLNGTAGGGKGER
ncbi:hypothetical protein [Streptomyces sp. NPDC058867]|uniref:hypothetical protein n=1 Tax=unclassified Streptomyces TaxID=2593676 RepID=UPI003681CDE3